MAWLFGWNGDEVVLNCGGFCFGAVTGWITRYTLAYTKEVTISSLSSVLAAVGGAAITNIFAKGSSTFALYCVGLAVAFFIYVALYDIDPKTGQIIRRTGVESPPDGTKAEQTKPGG